MMNTALTYQGLTDEMARRYGSVIGVGIAICGASLVLNALLFLTTPVWLFGSDLEGLHPAISSLVVRPVLLVIVLVHLPGFVLVDVAERLWTVGMLGGLLIPSLTSTAIYTPFVVWMQKRRRIGAA